jgi:hypothetical protein
MTQPGPLAAIGRILADRLRDTAIQQRRTERA